MDLIKGNPELIRVLFQPSEDAHHGADQLEPGHQRSRSFPTHEKAISMDPYLSPGSRPYVRSSPQRVSLTTSASYELV